MKNSELISFGQVHLEIRDLKQSVKFWHDLVGLNRLDETDEYAALGIDGAPLIVLHRSATRPISVATAACITSPYICRTSQS